MNLSNYHKFKRLFVNIKFLKEYHIKTPLFVSLIGVFVKVLNSLMVKIASPFDFCLSGLASPFQLSTNSKTCLFYSVLINSDVSRVFLGRPVHTSNQPEQRNFQNLCIQIL